MKKVVIWIALSLWSVMTVFAGETAYLFSYFINDSKDGLHLAYSYDGLNWLPLHGGRSYLTPAVGKDKLMRDPSICQSPDGTFHMVWTSSWTDRITFASGQDFNNLITGEHDNKSLEAVLKSIEFISGDIKYKKEGINVLLYKE